MTSFDASWQRGERLNLQRPPRFIVHADGNAAVNLLAGRAGRKGFDEQGYVIAQALWRARVVYLLNRRRRARLMRVEQSAR